MMAIQDNYETIDVIPVGMAVHVTLNRPHARNAMNFQMTRELTEVFQSLKGNRDYRAIILSGKGGMFCSGGDIKEMRENTVPASESAFNLDAMLQAVDTADQIVIAQVEGAALGGGLGLLCVSDIAIAATNTIFGLTEVRLGIAPAFISPYVLRRIGLTRSRELMLTGRRFNGTEAHAYGLVHDVCEPDEVRGCIDRYLTEIQQSAPGAIAAIKRLIFNVLDRPLDKTVDYRAEVLNTLRGGAEAQEGMLAFVEKRTPKWAEVTDDD